MPDRKRKALVTLRHLKARHTEARDVALTFDHQRQSFTPAEADEVEPEADTTPTNGRLHSELAALWGRTEPADDEAEGTGE